ncbi:MAG: extensin family protein, partial [Novosphingobium sp.]
PKVRQFFSAIHISACKRFGTVLGPAYNAAHKDHLHLELSGRAYCK